jgi:hypothetical protein
LSLNEADTNKSGSTLIYLDTEQSIYAQDSYAGYSYAEYCGATCYATNVVLKNEQVFAPTRL